MFLAAALLAIHGMLTIPSGTYTPLYGGTVRVASFTLDARPVTRGEFQKFVITHPEWRRSAVTPAMADNSYLDEWTSDVQVTDPDRSVTGVSRLAAEAYCKALGKRLPTVDEWEYAATLSRTHLGERGAPWEWTAAEHHHHGAHAMHDASCAGAAIGAADPTNYAAFQRFAVRSALSDTSTLRALGFRCAA